MATAGQAADWPTYQGNAGHTGYVPESLNTSQFAFKWQISAGSNPVAVGGKAVFVSGPTYFGNSGLYAYSTDTGVEMWHVAYSGLSSVNPPAYANGRVFIQTGKSSGSDAPYLRAYYSATGQLAFQSTFGAQWESYFAPTVVDNVVYIDGGYYGGMYAFGAPDGSQLWFNSSLPQYDLWTPAIDANYAYAYLGDYSPALYVINRSNGQLSFTIPDPNFSWNGWSMNSAPVLGGSNDVIAIHDGRLIRFDLSRQTIAWEQKASYVGEPTVAKGAVYAINSGAVNVRDEVTGALLWSWAAPSDTVSGTMIATDSHLLVSGASKVYAVNLATHAVDWSYAATGALALAGHALYINGGGKLTSIRVAAPQPYDDAATTYLAEPVVVDVLANDDGFKNPVTLSIATAPQHGTAVVNGSPGNTGSVTVTYTPDAGFLGTDSFQYTVSDGVLTGTATVTVTVLSPQTGADTATTHLSTPVAVDVLKNDVGFLDPATVTVITAPLHGSAVVTGSPGNASGIRITYTPIAGFAGNDTFQYQVTDGVNTGSATVSVKVLNFKATNDRYILLRGNYCCTSNSLFVLANDIGFGDPVSVTITKQPDKSGSVSVSGSPGTKSGVYIYYSPNTSLNVGDYTETFTYQVSDGVNSDTATVTIRIVTFIAQDDAAVTNVGDPVTINVGANDLGFSFPAIAGLYSAALHGNLTINNSPGGASGITITYDPDPGFKGTDTFQYAMDDGTHLGIATVTVNVINDVDHDGVDDSVDNCLGVYNPDQRDSDGDGYGNRCDSDLNNDGAVNFSDLFIFRQKFGTADPAADLDGNGVVNFADLLLLKRMFGKPPGPSALHPLCPPQCP